MRATKNKKSAAELSAQIQNNSFKKSYLAVTDGKICEKNGVYKDTNEKVKVDEIIEQAKMLERKSKFAEF